MPCIAGVLYVACLISDLPSAAGTGVNESMPGTIDTPVGTPQRVGATQLGKLDCDNEQYNILDPSKTYAEVECGTDGNWMASDDCSFGCTTPPDAWGAFVNSGGTITYPLGSVGGGIAIDGSVGRASCTNGYRASSDVNTYTVDSACVNITWTTSEDCVSK